MVQRFENLDIRSIVTPVNPDLLEELLIASNYDRDETKFLVEGFRNGFDIGYEGPGDRQDMSNNIPLKIGSKTTLWNKMMNEVKLKRFSGSFEEIPFRNYVQSPVGLVPKSGNSGKTRLIFHLSFDFKK